MDGNLFRVVLVSGCFAQVRMWEFLKIIRQVIAFTLFAIFAIFAILNMGQPIKLDSHRRKDKSCGDKS